MERVSSREEKQLRPDSQGKVHTSGTEGKDGLMEERREEGSLSQKDTQSTIKAMKHCKMEEIIISSKS